MVRKFFSGFLIVAFVLSMVGIRPSPAMAASITQSKATFGRLKVSANSESGTIQFATPTGIQTGGADTIIFTFSSEFVLAAEVAANFDIELGDSATCSTANYADEIVALAPSATDWGVDVTGNIITLSPETDETLTAGFCMRLVWGTAATTGGTGAASTIVNATDVDDDDTIVISGAFGDSGTITVDIIDDDQVSVTATVNQTLTFDIDAALTDGETSAPYSVALGTLSTGSVARSDTSTVNMIILEGATNASGGMNVTVANANGGSGLVSTGTPADFIASSTATMAAGTSNYGLCVATVNLTGFVRAVGTYDAAACALSGTNPIRGLTSTPANIITSSGVLAAGHAEVVVNAAISGSVPAHADYSDTLTFIGTATF